MLKRNQDGSYDRVDVAQPAPPAPTGTTLLELERSQNTTLRIAIDEYNGARYVSLSTWNADGWPVKGKTLSFRLRELPAILEVLGQIEQAEQGPPDPRARPAASPDLKESEAARPLFVDKRPRRPEPLSPGRTYPPQKSSEKPFTEFPDTV